MERVLVLGAKGMVGSELMGAHPSGFELIGLDRDELNVSVERETLQAIRDIKPGVVIHAAAYTDVDGCERDPDRAFSVNNQGTRHVALACRRTGAKLIYMSTDYVFDGKSSKPYREEDPVNPINVYGKSKLDGERHVQRLLDDFIIVRTQWLFGKGGRNFVTTVLGLANERRTLTIVQDQIGSPTYVVDLSRAIFRLLENGSQGVFHVANSSFCSWYDFAREIIKTAEIPDVEIVPVVGPVPGYPAPRPHYSVLNCERLTMETGVAMRSWQEGVREFLKRRGVS